MKRFLAGLLFGLLLFPAAALLAVRLGLWPTEGTAPPPFWESLLTGPAVHSAIRARAPRAANPLAPTIGSAHVLVSSTSTNGKMRG